MIVNQNVISYNKRKKKRKTKIGRKENHNKLITWSILTRTKVEREIKIKKQNKLLKNKELLKRKKLTKLLKNKIEEYSLKKRKTKEKERCSLFNPLTSSLSLSLKSNGQRIVSIKEKHNQKKKNNQNKGLKKERKTNPFCWVKNKSKEKHSSKEKTWETLRKVPNKGYFDPLIHPLVIVGRIVKERILKKNKINKLDLIEQ